MQEHRERSVSGGTRRSTATRVHLHTTISARTRELLRELAGETGRVNDVLEEAVDFFSKRKDIPSCDECEAMEVSNLRRSLIDSADMGLVSSRMLSVLADLGCSRLGSADLVTQLRKIGAEQTKLLRGLGTVPQEMWQNTFDSFVSNIKLLERMGLFRSLEIHPERKRVLATAKLMSEQPEILLAMVLAEWDEAGYTVDAEIVADSKISITWVEMHEYEEKKAARDERVRKMWDNRREAFLLKAGQDGAITLNPSLLEWLAEHNIGDALDEKTIVGVRNFMEHIDPLDSGAPNGVLERVRRAGIGVTSFGLLEKCDVRSEGDLVRVQMRSRTSLMKDMGVKILRALLTMENIDEFTREEGVTSAVLYVGEKPEVGRKY
ncbi:MAG: hypothetical protein JSW05_03905 [Candidatus Thorarchaeota archaeon]|nr:MAG: hypothetical protein JSW05_03905 [Candidatus Thorarchaeota archaeon]